jgi:hypothetical protein
LADATHLTAGGLFVRLVASSATGIVVRHGPTTSNRAARITGRP